MIFVLYNLSNFIICLTVYMVLGFIYDLVVSNRLLTSKDDFLFIIYRLYLIYLLDFLLITTIKIWVTLFMKSIA